MTRTTRALFRVCLFIRRDCVRLYVATVALPPSPLRSTSVRVHERVCGRVCASVVRAATCGVHLVRPLALYALTPRQINERRTERIYDLLLDIRGTWRQYRCSTSHRPLHSKDTPIEIEIASVR